MTRLFFKIIILLFCVLMLLSGCGSAKEDIPEYTTEEIVGAIADISDDEDGNVIIKLVDGRMFVLSNLKGDKGDPGETGEKGEQGEPGRNGLNGSDGNDGRDSYGDIDVEINPEFDIGSLIDTDNKLDIDIVIDKESGIIGSLIDLIKGNK